MDTARNKENEDKDYLFTVQLQLIGKPRLEEAISRYLQETIEQYFLERGEKVGELEIVGINKKR